MGCEWALREGMVLDAIGHHSRAEWTGDPRAIRRDSVLSLCRRCGWNEAHARKVASSRRSSSTAAPDCHHLDPADRELLELGALLHDIGEHVSMEGHERHTAYLIENGRLRGFRPDEVAVLACLGRFHKRGSPKAGSSRSPSCKRRPRPGDPPARPAAGRRRPDRSHAGRCATSRFTPVRGSSTWSCSRRRHRPGDVGAAPQAGLFERVFRCRLETVEAQLALPLYGEGSPAPAEARAGRAVPGAGRRAINARLRRWAARCSFARCSFCRWFLARGSAALPAAPPPGPNRRCRRPTFWPIFSPLDQKPRHTWFSYQRWRKWPKVGGGRPPPTGAKVARPPTGAKVAAPSIGLGSAGLSRSVARHLGPGQALVGPDVTRQAEHPLAEDVAHDLRGAAFDGVGPGG